ncbi:hypothetical protein K4749_19295 [Streptomyces sp. TRM72054]|uniref:hypothetical protein n=1 Tax=Streptomyces sp. TRM72054 TaxID=2870562 RepID=UPI001C8C1CAE|nr:hypothetical protein [Streptomyces sp. TRM72054]MBX9395684.1 hypothetical protein [Streptomyces sp. TRM72054]
MTTTPTSPDLTMEAIGRAVTEGRSGAVASARHALLDLWSTIGITGDPLRRCTLAHHMSDLHEDPAEALAWAIRALDAAEAVTEQRVQEHDSELHIAGFYPSLHLNLADNYRRLGSFEAAAKHIDAAREHAPDLPEGPYGDLLRVAIEEAAEAVTRRDTARRVSAPGSTA